MNQSRVPSIVLGVTAALVLIAFDPGAEASFDAPKRLVAMAGIAGACAAAVAFRVPLSIDRRAGLAAAAVLALAAIGAVLSPRPLVALDALRTIVVFAAVPLLCASIPDAWRDLERGFVAGALVNAVLSVLQWSGLAQPFRYATAGGRGETSALLGNTGVLAIVLAFAAAILLPRWRDPKVQAMLVVLVFGLAVNGSLTGSIALVAAALWHASRRVAVIAFATGAAVGIVCVGVMNVDTVNAALTYRLAPWSAAGEMFFARPLTGLGAGTFAAEYAPQYLAAEERWGLRFANPSLRGSYADAHNDVLQSLAELGAPATVVLAFLAVLAFRRSRAPLLVAGAVAALTWFPLQRPETALVLLAAAGVALAPAQPRRSVPATILAGLALVFATFEIPRYLGERRLHRLGVSVQAETIETYPGDWRPLHAAASAHFLAGDYAKAAELFQRANALGERPEIDVNLALALDRLGQRERAAQLRARAWRIAPRLSVKRLPAPSPSPSSRPDTSR